MAATIPNQAAPRTHGKARTMAGEAVPVYGLGDGVLSFRHGLLARERNAIDRALEIVGRCLRKTHSQFRSPDAVKAYLRLHMAGEQRERFAVLFLDSQNRALAFEIMFSGTLTQTSVYPREVVQAAIQHGATAVILAHNHPSGNVSPSRADEALTQTLEAALALVDVRVLDHIVVGGNEALSMAQCGFSPFCQVATPVGVGVSPHRSSAQTRTTPQGRSGGSTCMSFATPSLRLIPNGEKSDTLAGLALFLGDGTPLPKVFDRTPTSSRTIKSV